MDVTAGVGGHSPHLYVGHEALWTAVCTTAHHSLQGHVMLRNVRPGARVEVLEENVGAGERYHTVRDSVNGTVGLYPSDWLKKVG